VDRIIDFRHGEDREQGTEDDGIFISRRNIAGKLEGISARESLSLAEASKWMSVVSEICSIKIYGETVNKQIFKNTAVYSSQDRAVKLWQKQ